MNAWITGRERPIAASAAKAFEQPGLDLEPDPRALRQGVRDACGPTATGPLGYASAGVMADYVLVDMFAEAVTGQATPEDAMRRRPKRREPLLPRLTTNAAGGRPPPFPTIGGDSGGRRPRRWRPSRSLGRHDRKPNKPFSASCSCCRRRLSCSAFLTYPLGLGVWLGFTDTTIGRDGRLHRARELPYLAGTTAVFWLSVFNTLLYTVVASVLKFGLGLWLALLLNENLPFKILLPRHRPPALGRADRALGDRLLVDLRHPVLDHLLVLMQLG